MGGPPAKRQKVKGQDHRNGNEGPTISDPRFANIQSDPRFRLPRKKTNVKLDKRFSRILKDEDFSRKATVDRYGRPLETGSERERLKRRYDFEEDSADEEGTVDSDNEVQKELERVEKGRDPLRDGVASGSSSEESSSDEEELEDEAEVINQQEDDVPTGDVTSRIAVVNLDWDNIRAADLMAVFSSFLPPSGRLQHVAIYPSEFGKERMQREEMDGPPQEIFNPAKEGGDEGDYDEDEDDDEDNIKKSILKADEGEEFNSAKLRQYQLERLRYFYALLTFSSPEAAKVVYDAADGAEYLSTANFFDLRFVPDGTDFAGDIPREECKTIPDGYKPNEFITHALQHSKVTLSWDAEDNSRKEAQARAFRGGRKEIDENDIKAYLGTDSSDEEDQEPDANEEQPVTKKEIERQKMRALLGLGPEPTKTSRKSDAPVGGVQVTFSAGLSTQDGTKASMFENDPEPDETTVERYVRKERERKQKRKERLRHANDHVLPAATDKVANQDEADIKPVDAGFDDAFFADPEEDKAAAAKMRKEQRLKKRAEREADQAATAAQRAELELLMVDDQDAEVRHFDMNEIEKAEKRAKRKGKKNKDKVNSEVVQDKFEMDTQDPRFARLFENHEFAIDPTNPKFKATGGMKALLEEGRKRRKKDDKISEKGGLRADTDAKRREGQDVDVQELVKKVKKQKSPGKPSAS